MDDLTTTFVTHLWSLIKDAADHNEDPLQVFELLRQTVFVASNLPGQFVHGAQLHGVRIAIEYIQCGILCGQEGMPDSIDVAMVFLLRRLAGLQCRNPRAVWLGELSEVLRHIVRVYGGQGWFRSRSRGANDPDGPLDSPPPPYTERPMYGPPRPPPQSSMHGVTAALAALGLGEQTGRRNAMSE